MNYFIHDERDLSRAYVKGCEKFLHNLKLKAAASPETQAPSSKRHETDTKKDKIKT